MRLDTSKAWSEASATISANKEVLAAIAGVFFFLPALALTLFFPQPEPPAGADPKQLMAVMASFYRSVAPYMAVSALIQVLGQLTVLVLTAQAGRITVGEAIRAAAGGILPYIGAQLLLIAGSLLVFSAVAMVAALSVQLAVLLGIAAVVAAIYVGTRVALVPVVIAVERLRNPLVVLARSWALTRGNAGRILLFALVLLLAVVVISIVVSTLSGLLLTLIGGAEAARVGGAVISSAIGAAFAVYLAISFAAMHRQLAGVGSEADEVFL